MNRGKKLYNLVMNRPIEKNTKKSCDYGLKTVRTVTGSPLPQDAEPFTEYQMRDLNVTERENLEKNIFGAVEPNVESPLPPGAELYTEKEMAEFDEMLGEHLEEGLFSNNPNGNDTESSYQDLNTNTPFASPSTSLIAQNLNSELSFSNINTPSESVINLQSPLIPADSVGLSSAVNSPTLSTFSARSSLSNSEYVMESESNNSDAEMQIPKKRKRVTKKKSEPGKRREVRHFEWKDIKRKILKNQGLAYESRDGNKRDAKILLPACNETCRIKCNQKISTEVRQKIFDKFWSLGDRVRQWDFLTRWSERITKRRITTEGPSKRNFTVRYYLPTILECNSENKRVMVCRTMFLNTFAIGEGIVRTALNKYQEGDDLIVSADGRGRHTHHKVVKDAVMIRSVMNHVKSFSPVESHYTRKESTKLYLDSNLTMMKMFKLYKEWITNNDNLNLYSNFAKTPRQYQDIVNENFNIGFHRPKKDQCDECISFKNLIKPVPQDVQERYDTHIKNKDLARTMKNDDKLTALNAIHDTVTAAFDFQKVHNAPHADTSILYYKRKLNVFNFTIFDMGKKRGICYMWHEGIAKRGANEVSSCLLDFIKSEKELGVKNFIFYSDNCGGQNRNRIVFAMFLYASKKFEVNITHRFFEKGHTQNENDSIHALIERCARNKTVYTPEQWFALVRWAKQTGDPYIVHEMSKERFYNFKILLIGKNWAKNDQNQKVYLSKIKDVKIVSAEEDVVYYKTKFEDTPSRLKVSRSHSRRRPIAGNDDLPLAYNGPIPIPTAKFKDLKYLCEHNVIPQQYHSFFYSLLSADVDISEEED